MRSNSGVLILGARDVEQQTTAETASILARVIDKKVAKTKMSFLTFSWDT